MARPTASERTAVFFDCDGTLLEFTRQYGEIIAETLTEHLGTAPDDLVRVYDEAFYDAFSAVEPEPVLCGMRAVREEARDSDGAAHDRDDAARDSDGAAHDRDHGDVDPEAMVETLHEAELSMVEPAAGATALLDGLGPCHVGVLTNGVPDWQRSKLAHHGLLDRVDSVIASYEAGAHKPDPAPYDLARERAPDHVERFVMVGDDHEPDVAGARAAGFEAIHLDRERASPAVPSLEALEGLRSL